jgi:hypothetical protein
MRGEIESRPEIENERKGENKIVQEDQPSKSLDATVRLQEWFQMHTHFEETKKYLKKVGNVYINNLFNFLGYHYKGKVENSNILHMSAEAWLLGVLGELKKENSLIENKNVSYYTLLSHLKQVIVEENTFLDNMKLLTGVYGVEETALNDSRIFKMFLVNIQDNKNGILLDGDIVTRQNFDDTILRTLRVSFNFTLNEFNSNEEDKKSVDMINTYLEIKAKQNEEPEPFTFEIFSRYYIEKKNINLESLPQEEERKLYLHLNAFYDFCQTDFEDLIEEIKLFNENAGSLLFKIKNLVSLKNIRRMYIKYFDLLTQKVECGMKNLRLEGVLNFCRSIVKEIKPYTEKALTIAKVKYTVSRKWLNSTVTKYEEMSDPLVKQFKAYYRIVYDNYLKCSEIPRELFLERVYLPAKNLTLGITNKSVNLFVDTCTLGLNKTNELKTFLAEKVAHSLQNVKSNFFGEEPLVKVNYHEKEGNKDYMSISISKKLFLIDPTKASELVKNIIDKISHLNVTDSALQAICYVQVKASGVKSYMISSYKRFLDLASEDEDTESNNSNHIKSD